MKALVSKVIKPWLNRFKSYKPTKHLNKKTIPIIALIILFLVIFSYLFRPFYFDYEIKKDILKDKIQNVFKLRTNLNGDISYQVFPSPRIIINHANLNFGKTKKEKIKIKELKILISPLKLKSVENLKLKKILVSNQVIEIHALNLKNFFKYLSKHKEEEIILKNSQIIFIDQQGNKLNFDYLNLKDKFVDNKHQIRGSVNFSNNKINIKFLNHLGSEKYLKINIPKLKQSLDINFDSTSTLENLSGELKLKIFETILLINFKGKDNFEITRSYLRNKFLNSKIKGQISFKNQFGFNLDLDINQINLRKLLLHYEIFQKGGISKKINGKLNVIIKNSDSLFGKIKDAKMNLVLENGDVRISNFSASLPDKSQLKSNILILFSDKRPKIEFKTSFLSNNINKFIRKFGVYNFDENQVSLYVDGAIDIKNKKIKFKKIIKDNNQSSGKVEIKILENSFNQHVLQDGVLGLLDFFKFKKFFQENY